jgi:hypothetical protein
MSKQHRSSKSGAEPRQFEARDEDYTEPFLAVFSDNPQFEQLHAVAQAYLNIPPSLAGLWQILANLPEVLGFAKEWCLDQKGGSRLEPVFTQLEEWVACVEARRSSPELQEIRILSKINRLKGKDVVGGDEDDDGADESKEGIGAQGVAITPPFRGIEDEHPVWMVLWFASGTLPEYPTYDDRRKAYLSLQGLYLAAYMLLAPDRQHMDLLRFRQAGLLLRKLHKPNFGRLLDQWRHSYSLEEARGHLSDKHHDGVQKLRQGFGAFAELANLGFQLGHPDEFLPRVGTDAMSPKPPKKNLSKHFRDLKIYDDHYLYRLSQGFPSGASAPKDGAARPQIEWQGPSKEDGDILFEEGYHPGEFIDATEIFFQIDDFRDPPSVEGGPRELPPLNTLYAAARARYRMEIMRAQSFRTRVDRARIPLFLKVLGVLKTLYSESAEHKEDRDKALLNETVLLCAVALITGHSLKEAASLIDYGHSEKRPDEWQIAYFPAHRVWLRPYPIPERNENANKIYNFQLAVQPRMAFSDVWSLGGLLPESKNGKWFTQSQSSYRKVFISEITPALKAAGVADEWAEVDALSELLPTWFEGLEEGELLRNCAIFGRSSPQSEVQAHYVALKRSNLDAYYCQIMEDLWVQIQAATPVNQRVQQGVMKGQLFNVRERSKIPDDLTGNDWAPKIEGIKTLLEMLRIKIAQGSDDPYEYHNWVAAYTGIALSIVTGFRNSNTPILDLSLIDPETGFMHMEEKDHENGSHARLVWIPQEVRACVTQYLNHLKSFWAMLDFQEKAQLTVPATKNRDIRIYGTKSFPLSLQSALFLYLKTEKGYKPKEFSGRRLQGLLNTFEKGAWPIPNNGRHFLATNLFNDSEQSFATIIKTVMGHWHLGESPWGPDSAMDPYQLREALKVPFEKLLGTDGVDFRAIEF